MSKYDPQHRLSASTEDERFQQYQWLFFQASGQGPYFGQADWFLKYHPEKVPGAVERYQNEVRRILGVLNDVLSKQEWLIAGKPTIVDLSFATYVPLHDVLKLLLHFLQLEPMCTGTFGC